MPNGLRDRYIGHQDIVTALGRSTAEQLDTLIAAEPVRAVPRADCAGSAELTSLAPKPRLSARFDATSLCRVTR
jgi:hypothetical protein